MAITWVLTKIAVLVPTIMRPLPNTEMELLVTETVEPPSTPDIQRLTDIPISLTDETAD